MKNYAIINEFIYYYCGEELDMLFNTKVTEIAENTYHLQYKEDDFMDGLDLKVEFTFKDSHIYCRVFESVYADDGEFMFR